MTKYKLILGAFIVCALQTNGAERLPYDDAAYARESTKKLNDRMVENKILTQAEVEETKRVNAKLVEDINGANSRGDDEAATIALKELGNLIAYTIKKNAESKAATLLKNK